MSVGENTTRKKKRESSSTAHGRPKSAAYNKNTVSLVEKIIKSEAGEEVVASLNDPFAPKDRFKKKKGIRERVNDLVGENTSAENNTKETRENLRKALINAVIAQEAPVGDEATVESILETDRKEDFKKCVVVRGVFQGKSLELLQKRAEQNYNENEKHSENVTETLAEGAKAKKRISRRLVNLEKIDPNLPARLLETVRDRIGTFLLPEEYKCSHGSILKSVPELIPQDFHADWAQTEKNLELKKNGHPRKSMIIATQISYLHVEDDRKGNDEIVPIKIQLNAGDIILFDYDVYHAGDGWNAAGKHALRFFLYLSTEKPFFPVYRERNADSKTRKTHASVGAHKTTQLEKAKTVYEDAKKRPLKDVKQKQIV